MVYGDEDCFEHQILSRFIIPNVNAGLAHAQQLLKHTALLHLGRKGRCGHNSDDDRLNPDWSLVNDQLYYPETGKYLSVLNGDTKLSAKWGPELRSIYRDEWQLPIRQVLTYAKRINCRYGFIITDAVLVVFQFAYEVVGPGLAATREIRAPQPAMAHRRVMSDQSQLSEAMQGMSISGDSLAAGSHGAQEYVETGQTLEFQHPKYRVIPWSNKGEDDLTVKSGLFYLCMMAGYGSRHIDIRYPRLNTWWHYQAGGPFIHNASSFLKKKLGSKDKLEDPNPAAQSAPVTEDHEDHAEHADHGDHAEHAVYAGYADYAEGSGTIVVDTGTAYMEEAQARGGENEDTHVDEAEGAYTDDSEGAHVDDDGGSQDEETGVGEGQAYSGKGKEVDRTGQSRVGGRALPRLQAGSVPIVNTVFIRSGGIYYLKDRKGHKVPIKKKEWVLMEYKGKPTLVRQGKKTIYITEKLP